jgi:hypothetical protein
MLHDHPLRMNPIRQLGDIFSQVNHRTFIKALGGKLLFKEMRLIVGCFMVKMNGM